MSYELYHLIIFKQKKAVFRHIAFDTDCFNYRHDPKGLRLNKVDKKVSNVRMVQAPTEFRAPSHPPPPSPTPHPTKTYHWGYSEVKLLNKSI